MKARATIMATIMHPPAKFGPSLPCHYYTGRKFVDTGKFIRHQYYTRIAPSGTLHWTPESRPHLLSAPAPRAAPLQLSSAPAREHHLEDLGHQLRPTGSATWCSVCRAGSMLSACPVPACGAACTRASGDARGARRTAGTVVFVTQCAR